MGVLLKGKFKRPFQSLIGQGRGFPKVSVKRRIGQQLDEEAAELIRLQQAFQGAAKLMQVSAEIFEAMLQASR